MYTVPLESQLVTEALVILHRGKGARPSAAHSPPPPVLNPLLMSCPVFRRRFPVCKCMPCSCTKQTFIPHTKEGLYMLLPLRNSSSFESNLMPRQFFFRLNVCIKKYRKRWELTVKGKLNDTLGARGFFFQGWKERSGQRSTIDLVSRSILSDLEKEFPWHPG